MSNMYKYFQLSKDDKSEFMGIAERLRGTSERNLSPQPLPENLNETELTVAEQYSLPGAFFDFFTVEAHD